jgi:hypothetical protein
MVIKGRDADRFLKEMDAAVMTPERLRWLKDLVRQSKAATRTDYGYMILQNGQPMHEDEDKDRYWALYFASRSEGPTLYAARKWARNAINRQKRKEKKHGSSLGSFSVMRVLLP